MGNELTKLMHALTMKEFEKMQAKKEIKIQSIVPEAEVSLPKGKKGSYDFLIELKNGKKLGFEILARPTKGKMKNKLVYLDFVDEFIFVIRANEFSFYKKPAGRVFHKELRQKFFPKEFSNPKLHVWLLHVKHEKFTRKASFNNVFNTEK